MISLIIIIMYVYVYIYIYILCDITFHVNCVCVYIYIYAGGRRGGHRRAAGGDELLASYLIYRYTLTYVLLVVLSFIPLHDYTILYYITLYIYRERER